MKNRKRRETPKNTLLIYKLRSEIEKKKSWTTKQQKLSKRMNEKRKNQRKKQNSSNNSSRKKRIKRLNQSQPLCLSKLKMK